MPRGKSSVKRDVFVNRVRGRLAFGANPSTPVFETFNTGMNVGRTDPMKWIILGCTLQPDPLSATLPSYTSTSHLIAQLMIGTQDAMLNADDMQVVATGHKQWTAITSGLSFIDWPMSMNIPHPIPVFAQALTIGMDGVLDATGTDSVDFYYEIQYLRASISQNEIVEYLAAFGQV